MALGNLSKFLPYMFLSILLSLLIQIITFLFLYRAVLQEPVYGNKLPEVWHADWWKKLIMLNVDSCEIILILKSLCEKMDSVCIKDKNRLPVAFYFPDSITKSQIFFISHEIKQLQLWVSRSVFYTSEIYLYIWTAGVLTLHLIF